MPVHLQSERHKIIYPPDYHTHTRLCKHAEGMPLDYARAALENGLTEMACTDHLPAPDHYDPEHRMASRQFDEYRQAVREAQSLPGLTVLLGVEADFYEGCEEALKPWLLEHPFDIVLGSVHSGDFWDYENEASRVKLTPDYVAEVWRKYFALLQKLAATRMYDVLGHFDLPKRSGVRPNDRTLRECVLPALDAVAEAGMSVEINTSGLNHPMEEPYPSVQILGWARERDISITFGSDAHQPRRVGADFEFAMTMARDAGYTHSARYRGRTKTLAAF
ncbi:MAG: histidinol-phosphatase HisJ family protein [Lentisphaerota bacterium]